MRRAEVASGRLSALLHLAFLAAIVFVGIKILPAYVNNYQLEDHIRQLSIRLAARGRVFTADQVREEVVDFARDHDIVLAADSVRVAISNRVLIYVDYTVPVDLIVYTLRLHFAPSAENQTL
jgi:hypothetical protein